MKGAKSIRAKFPFKDDVLKDMVVLDPVKREEVSTDKSKFSNVTFTRILNVFTISICKEDGQSLISASTLFLQVNFIFCHSDLIMHIFLYIT